MSRIYDHRINSTNLYVETTFGEYLEFASEIIKNNDLQRNKVKTSKSVYSLLKTDLQKGCLMPPLVLAVTSINGVDIKNMTGEELMDYIQNNSEKVMILDGLQRTHSLIAADNEMEKSRKKKGERLKITN